MFVEDKTNHHEYRDDQRSHKVQRTPSVGRSDRSDGKDEKDDSNGEYRHADDVESLQLLRGLERCRLVSESLNLE